jgi:hypothetical protein
MIVPAVAESMAACIEPPGATLLIGATGFTRRKTPTLVDTPSALTTDRCPVFVLLVTVAVMVRSLQLTTGSATPFTSTVPGVAASPKP